MPLQPEINEAVRQDNDGQAIAAMIARRQQEARELAQRRADDENNVNSVRNAGGVGVAVRADAQGAQAQVDYQEKFHYNYTY